MESTLHSPTRTILILKADRVYAETLRQLALATFPDARVVTVNTVEAASRALVTTWFDLLITGTGSSLGSDVLDFIAGNHDDSARPSRVLVVSTRLEEHIVVALRTMTVQGVFDAASEEPENLPIAVKSVAAARPYWSASVLDRLQHSRSAATSILHLLTVAEQMMLSVVGDGCDDESAARQLGLSAFTVSTVRRQLHRKLGVQHRGELMRVAAQNGFVRFTPAGVVRPGFSFLSAAYNARRPKRVASMSA